MNKVIHINLGGMPFIIDEDAYEALRDYLAAIHSHFRNSEGYEEITADIEARLAELFRESMGHRQIVTMKDVQEAIRIMGTPEVFEAEGESAAEGDAAPSGKQDAGAQPRWRTGRRLFRDPDDQVLGGVCSGLAAYLGIEDPIWVRLAFVLFTLSGGFGIPLYIILWIIVPEAKTASDRLAMRGEPINVSNIGKIIEEEMSQLSKRVSEFAEELGKEDWGGKKKSGRQRA